MGFEGQNNLCVDFLVGNWPWEGVFSIEKNLLFDGASVEELLLCGDQKMIRGKFAIDTSF